MVKNPKNKYEIPPVKIPAFDVKLIETGSGPGKITLYERVRSFLMFWGWHLLAAASMAIELAASYLNSNIGLVEAKYGFVVASVVFGLTGLIKGYREMLRQKAMDTRGEEDK